MSRTRKIAVLGTVCAVAAVVALPGRTRRAPRTRLEPAAEPVPAA